MWYTAGMSDKLSRPSDPEALRAAARVLAAGRRVVGTIACAVCGTEVVATTAGAPGLKRRYCSNACKVKAYRHAHLDELNARQRERRAQQRQRSAPTP